MEKNESNGLNAVIKNLFTSLIFFTLIFTSQAQIIKPAMACKKISPDPPGYSYGSISLTTGDIILKLVNFGTETKTMKVNLSGFKKINPAAEQTTLTGKPDAENNVENSGNIIPLTTGFKVAKNFDYQCLPMSLTVIRIKTK